MPAPPSQPCSSRVPAGPYAAVDGRSRAGHSRASELLGVGGPTPPACQRQVVSVAYLWESAAKYPLHIHRRSSLLTPRSGLLRPLECLLSACPFTCNNVPSFTQIPPLPTFSAVPRLEKAR